MSELFKEKREGVKMKEKSMFCACVLQCAQCASFHATIRLVYRKWIT